MYNGLEEAKALIAENKKTKAEFLDLGNLGLTELPEALFELTHLKTLNIGVGHRENEDGQYIYSRGYEHYDLLYSGKQHLRNKITTLPDALRALIRLEKLYANYTKIEDIAVLQQLTSLTSLYLSGHKIEDISSLKHLTNLTSLDLSGHEIEDISSLKHLTNLTSLDLSHTQIENISTLQHLTNLTSLHLNGTKIEDISALRHLTNLTSLHLSGTKIEDISALRHLTNLTSLSLSGTKIEDISTLQHLISLTSLNLIHTQIEDFSSLQHLTNLTFLYLSGTKIEDISTLQHLTNLTFLGLRGTKIEDISTLQHLTTLTSLYLWGTKIEDISTLQHLTSLTYLNLSETKIEDISTLQHLTSLTSLNLSHTKIEDISTLQHLTSLTSLDLGDTKIEDISTLQHLTNLTSLDLGGTQIEDISALQHLINLTSLSLWDTKIEDFSILQHLTNLTSLDLRGIQSKTIPYEILEQHNCLEDFRNWFYDLSQGSIANQEVKLMIIGNGRVGKTCIVERLLHQRYNAHQASTHAIQIEAWQLKLAQAPLDQLLVRVWDFGGQEIYHATHRLFMQSRALYLLAWDALTEDAPETTEEIEGEQFIHRNYKLPYYLDYVRSYSKESPVVIVQNKMDRDGRQRPPNQIELDQMYRVSEYCSVSAEQGRGFESLEEIIKDVFLHQMPEVGMEMPLSWYEVRETIRAMAASNTDIPLARFEEICEAHQVRKISRPSLLRYLHNTGNVFHQENLFQNSIILDQKWAIEAVYLIFDRKKPFFRLKKGQGRFKFSDLDIPLNEKEYNAEKRKIILSFMESCEICFQANREDKSPDPDYIAPELLQDDKPKHVAAFWETQNTDTLHWIYKHPVLHRAFIQRFIVRAGHLAAQSDMWKDGIHFSYSESAALVEAKPNDYSGIIYVRTTGAEKERLLRLIRKEFKDIYHYNEKVELEELISRNGIDFISLKKLKEEIEADNEKVVSEQGNRLAVEDYRLFTKKVEEEEDRDQEKKQSPIGLQDLQPTKIPQPATATPIKIFISYAHEDESYKDRLKEELLTWEVTEKVTIFDDRKLQVSKSIDEGLLKEQLEPADLVIFLVSKDFLKSKYCMKLEVPMAMENFKNKKCRVLPILVKPVPNYSMLPFSNIASLPKDIVSIEEHTDKEVVWTAINAKLTELLGELMHQKSQ